MVLIYLIFALTTAIIAHFILYLPSIDAVSGEGLIVEDNKWLLLATLFGLTILIAPFIFPSCISNSYGERFRTGLERSFRQQ